MSGSNIKLRQTISPSGNKNGPLKATKSFGLVELGAGSPTNEVRQSGNNRRTSPTTSPEQQNTEGRPKSRQSPDFRSPEKNSPSSPCSKGEKLKNIRNSPVGASNKRNESLAGSYLIGQWPAGPQTQSTGTQTPADWEEQSRRKNHRRSASAGNSNDARKDMLRRMTGSPCGGSVRSQKRVTSPNIMQSRNIPRTTRLKLSSIEGPNQEIQQAMRTNSGQEEEYVYIRSSQDAPDGHVAPTKELMRSLSSSSTNTPPSSYIFCLGVNPEPHRSLSVQSTQTTSIPPTPSSLEEELHDDVVNDNVSDGLSENGNVFSPTLRLSSYPGITDMSQALATLSVSSSRCSELNYSGETSPSVTAANTLISNNNSATVSTHVSTVRANSSASSDQKDLAVTCDTQIPGDSPDVLKVAASPKPNKSFVREPPDGCERIKTEEPRSSTPMREDYSNTIMQHQAVILPSRNSAFKPQVKLEQ